MQKKKGEEKEHRVLYNWSYKRAAAKNLLCSNCNEEELEKCRKKGDKYEKTH